MNTINDVLDYYINFELEERLYKIAINKNNYLNLSKNKLTDLSSIESLLTSKKITLIKTIINAIKFKNEDRKKDLIKLLNTIENGSLTLKEGFDFNNLVSKSEYKYGDNYAKDNLEINKIINDNKIYILYPVFAFGKQKIPLISFQVEIKDNKIIVENYRVQIEALRTIISQILSCDRVDVEYAMPDFEKFYEAISVYENTDIFELITIIENELIGKFTKELFTGFWSYKDYGNWAVTEEIILTMESFGEMILPPYQEEIEEVKFHLKDKNSKLLDQYLFGCDTSLYSENIKINTHYGSYTSAYPINEKQAKVINSYKISNLLAVSGPPGTGKTTVIKEVIANNIVEKAIKILGIWNQSWEKIGWDNQEVYQSPLKGKCDYSMLIASGNNKAVDNIGLELLEEIDYFSEALDTNKTGYKGILCARLGNQDNTESFKNDILNPLINYLEKETIYDEQKANETIVSFKASVNNLLSLKETISDFSKHREILCNKMLASNVFDRELDEQIIEKAKSKYNHEVSILIETIKQLENKLSALEKRKVIIINEIAKKSNNLKKINEELDKKRQYVQLIDKKAKIILIGHFLARSLENKYGSRSSIYENVSLLENDYNLEKILYNQQEAEFNTLEEQLTDAHNLLEDRKREIDKVKEILLLIDEFEKLKGKAGDLIKLGLKDVNWNSSEYDLFNNNYIVQLRYDLFKKSLLLIKLYICKNARYIHFNLEKVYPDKWFQAFYRRDFRYDIKYEGYLKAMWETLFLCFPVVTTTLFSLNRMKFPLIQGLYDTILIDEAGQYSIHTVIAPIYRCRKAIIVGDTKQIEPIRNQNNYVIENSKLSDQMKQLFDVNLNSIQNAADRASDVYDILDDKKVGIILNEHRRCERSIVEFSNQYVYKNQLKIIKEDTVKPFLKYSLCMIDVRSVEVKRHINNAEIDMCVKIIDRLLVIYGNDYKKNIGIITPFRKQADALKARIPEIECGTVHLFQGREKDIILFSIVSGGTDSRGSMNFIGKQANNLNVAFTRAKKQLILIGNYEACVNAKNYMSLAMNVLKESGKLFSIYEGDIFEENNLEEGYKEQFYSLFIESNVTQKLVDLELANYVENGLIVTPQKHNLLLLGVLTKLENSLRIVTPWIRSSVVNASFLDSLRLLLNEKKEVNISFGYHKTNYDLSNIAAIVKRDNYGSEEKDIKSIQELHDLIKDHLEYIPPIHCKILIIDDRIMIIGSHNWLSNSGKAINAKDEISCIIYDKNMIQYVKERYFNTLN
ncbi:AAA domain-containing protein [Dielma fastidiosa]|uniref:AAA domain-containing protein n=1 Tax=Dielma fastidiosa TaxID=1034346 RepID=UPI003567FCD9